MIRSWPPSCWKCSRGYLRVVYRDPVSISLKLKHEIGRDAYAPTVALPAVAGQPCNVRHALAELGDPRAFALLS
ncbi:hypothetical protein SPHINGO8AM_310003 [Sphingomonas sp. 8AM]|nr:hypothetical protein SPHINGO8AM_310003 [Sphingomonas sp. 8AM]